MNLEPNQLNHNEIKNEKNEGFWKATRKTSISLVTLVLVRTWVQGRYGRSAVKTSMARRTGEPANVNFAARRAEEQISTEVGTLAACFFLQVHQPHPKIGAIFAVFDVFFARQTLPSCPEIDQLHLPGKS